jgi:hypothetical protein
MTKIFVRTNDLGEERPILIAQYNDGYPIADNAHGDGMTVLTVPREIIGRPSKDSCGLPSLVAGWRDKAGSMPVKAEAQRRIEEGFSTSDQLTALRDMLEAVMTHGVDANAWPPDVKARKIAFDEKWKYVTDIQNKMREHAVMPRDPASDKVWPQRPRKT